MLWASSMAEQTSKWLVKTSICLENGRWPTVISSTATHIRYMANTLAYTNCNPAYSQLAVLVMQMLSHQLGCPLPIHLMKVSRVLLIH